MKISKLLAILVIVFASPALRAQESIELSQSGDLEMRISHMEAELATMQSSLCRMRACKTQCKPNRSGWDGGFSAFFAKPHMKESFQATTADLATGTLNLEPFSFDHDFTPRVWLGYFGEQNMGFRTRYWEFDHDANSLTAFATPTTFPGVSSVSVIFPAAISTLIPGDGLSVNSGLDVQTFDLEGTIRANVSNIDLVAFGGVRYASMEQHFDSVVFRGTTPISSLNWIRDFKGTGLTAGVDAQRQLVCSGMSVFGSARGSLLYGEKELRRQTFGDVTPPSAAAPPFVVLEDADEVSGIFELSLGAQWSRPTEYGNLFVRGSYETQLWTSAGAPTLTFLGFDGVGLTVGLQR